MHDKFIVRSGATVETGSFSFTAAAEAKNAVNVLVLHDPAVAQRYGQHWERLWGRVGGGEDDVSAKVSGSHCRIEQ
jgi:phosphatidylserine/phosphatidylglycerophosphate/cardiolipin synthase-like enzyme